MGPSFYMLQMTKANQKRIRYFLKAHEGHEIKIVIRAGGDLRVGLSYHNGDCWMGDCWMGLPKDLDWGLRELFQQAARWRPDLFPRMP